MLSNWEVVELGNLLEPKRGISYGIVQPGNSKGDGIPIVRVSDIRNGRISIDNPLKVSREVEERYSRTRLQGGELLLTLVGTVGETAVVPTSLRGWNTARAVAVIPVRRDIGAFWIRLALQSSLVRHIIDSRLNTTVQATLNLGDVAKLPVVLPPKHERDAIASVLGALDDKIELNRRMNATLEGMARALFQSWFVDFDPVRAKMDGRPTGLPAEIDGLFPAEMEDGRPRGWGQKVLDDLSDYVIGGDWGKDELEGDFITPAYCIRGADIPDLQSGGLGKMPTRYLKGSSLKKRKLQDGDLVIEISGGSPTQSTGRVVLITDHLLSRLDKPLVFSNFCRLVRLSDKSTSNFIYLWMRWLYHRDDFLQYENGTTGIKNFAFTLFSKQFGLTTPTTDIMQAFDELISPLIKKMQLNGAEIEALAALRDALLPKLMSGEVRVPLAEQAVADAL